MFTLGRGIDIHYPTNRLIIILTVLTAMIGGVISGNFMGGLKIGGTIFLTWAMGRELDPKREYGAFVSVAFALYGYFIAFNPLVNVAFMEVFFFMLILRLISTTCGKQPTWFDALIVLGAASYLSYNSKNPIYLLLYFTGLFVSEVFKENTVLRMITNFLAVGSIGYLLFLLSSQATFNNPIFSLSTLLIMILLYSLLAFIDLKKEKMIYDDQNNEIAPIKILKSQLFFVMSLILLIFLSDIVNGNIILYGASLSGLTFYGIISRILSIEE